MKYFEYLTTAYVQTGEYKVRNFYRQGQHYLQGVGNVGSAGGEVSDSLPFTATHAGVYTLDFTGTTGDDTYTVLVNGTAVDSADVDNGDDGSFTVEVVVGDEIDLEADDSGVANPISLVYTGNVPFPKFSRDWAAFSDGRDDLKGYDPASYGIGVKASERAVVIPRVKEVSLFYLVHNISTQEQKTLVQFDGDLSDAIAAGLVASDGSTGWERIVRTEQEYLEKWTPKGFNRFGKVLPPLVSESQVNELTSFTGVFVDVDGNSSNYTVYISPTYMYNGLPLFDQIYLENGFTGGMDSKDTGIPGHFMRWLGGTQSGTIAPINREGDAVVRDGYIYASDGVSNTNTVKTPSDATTSHDDNTYTNADEYNVRNFRRY